MPGVVIVGCGTIAGPYAASLAGYPELDLCGVSDVDGAPAHELADAYGIRAYSSFDHALEDPAVDIVVNLTTHHAHRGVTGRALTAGRHVHSEKRLALTAADASALVELAERYEVRLSCVPATFLGEAQQTALAFVREGRLGPVRVVYAEVNWGPIEAWHPAPQSFYEVGPLFDVGVYPLAQATAMFGPATRVTAYGRVVRQQRQTVDGVPFGVSTPDLVVAAIEFDDGAVLRLTASFYVGGTSGQKGMEFHGDRGTLMLHDWLRFDSPLTHRRPGGDAVDIPLVHHPYHGVEWGRPVRDLVAAIAEKRPHRATGQQAARIVEILDAARRSYESGAPVPVLSRFDKPAPMEWAV